MKPESVRALFPVTERYAYFNAAANGPLPRPVLEAIEGYAHDLARHGSLHYRDWFEACAAARTLSARLIGASSDEIALVRNTSEGINVVANGLRLGRGDSVVLVHGDFPANVHPWLRLREHGVDVRLVRPDPLGRIAPEQLLSACDASTRIVSVSFVSFATGFRQDLSQLGALLRRRGVLFFVDAIQGLGVLDLDVERDQIDFLAADAHKWLLVPEGIGLFYVRRERLERLRPTFVSWLSMKDPFDAVQYRGELHDDARRFEYATPNTMGAYALRAALELLLAVSVPAIEEHVLRLTDRLCEGLRARGYRLRSPRDAGERSGIVSFDHREVPAQQIHDRLVEASVQVALRAGGVRAAVHLYNDEGDVERLLEALPR